MQQIVCPHCSKEFIHNRVNGVALVQLVSEIQARKRMYLKLTLDSFERLVEQDAFTLVNVRKVLFDNVNDLVRDIETFLGFGTEAE